MKKDMAFILYVLFLLILLSIYTFTSVFKFIEDREKLKAEKQFCIRMIIEEDHIYNDCDKYFYKDKWYNDYMIEINYQYDKIR